MTGRFQIIRPDKKSRTLWRSRQRSLYILVDKPFSGGLDPGGILVLKRVLQRLASDRQVTVLMRTLVPELVVELSHRVAIINHGELVAFEKVDGLR